MLMVIDVGNTHTCFAVFQRDTVVTNWRICTVKQRTADEYYLNAISVLQINNIDFAHIDNIIISSVVPSVNSAIRLFCQRMECNAVFVDEVIDSVNIKLLIDNPKEIGIDRVVNAISAYNVLKDTLIVLDCGTATTFDVVDQHGNYCGGIIAPGISLSLSALCEATSKLPDIDIVKNSQYSW